MENTVFSSLRQYGFDAVTKDLCVGTRRNYAVTIQRFGGQTFNIYLAIRIPATSKELRTALKDASKATGVKGASMNRVTPNFVAGLYPFSKENADPAVFLRWLDAMIDVLAQNGVGPANTCAVTGAPNPDSLCCLLGDPRCFGYQPVCAAEVRKNDYEVQSETEHNELNGSYLTGLLGAVLGTVVGIAANLLTIVFLERILVVLFALVPVAAMYGYKLFKGKTNKVSIGIIIVLSLLAVPVMELLSLGIEASRELGISFEEGVSWAFRNFTHPTVMDAIKGDLIKMVLFMGLGVGVAWGFMSKQLNSTQVKSAQLRLDSMRPNPNYQAPQQSQPE